MDADELCNWLLEQDPHLVLRWLHEVLEGTRQIPEKFNWLGLAEISAGLARHKDGTLSSPPDLGWARVAVLVNTYLIYQGKEHGRFISARFVTPYARERACFTLEQRVMRIRAEFIMDLGSLAGDPVLDVEHLVQSFFENLTLSPEEALKKCARGKKALSKEETWELARIQWKLDILVPLAERQLLQSHADLLAWLSIRDQLHIR